MLDSIWEKTKNLKLSVAHACKVMIFNTSWRLGSVNVLSYSLCDSFYPYRLV